MPGINFLSKFYYWELSSRLASANSRSYWTLSSSSSWIWLPLISMSCSCSDYIFFVWYSFSSPGFGLLVLRTWESNASSILFVSTFCCREVISLAYCSFVSLCFINSFSRLRLSYFFFSSSILIPVPAWWYFSYSWLSLFFISLCFCSKSLSCSL